MQSKLHSLSLKPNFANPWHIQQDINMQKWINIHKCCGYHNQDEELINQLPKYLNDTLQPSPSLPSLTILISWQNVISFCQFQFRFLHILSFTSKLFWSTFIQFFVMEGVTHLPVLRTLHSHHCWQGSMEHTG